MIGQYLLQTNESAAVLKSKKFFTAKPGLTAREMSRGALVFFFPFFMWDEISVGFFSSLKPCIKFSLLAIRFDDLDCFLVLNFNKDEFLCAIF